ncbi:uncharacterized protein [Physcomitrium patens]|uniref:uncharacterized protein isoform X2 n=1 Tax=Physcomitrium patens TaxID=3218 RepID=UPI000D16FB6C|nr:trichohyalin-like isoform X2 [Physcomitrium patens]|eukprot:XP_024396324.1 trichohyalin-like isoform X2 [Physcomitrella patens]
MGDCGRSVQVESCATSLAQDMSVAGDIARRFEQLETQWMSFQKKSSKLEGDKGNLQKPTASSPRNHSQKNAVSCASSSYSNPLFTNHTTAKPSQTTGERTPSSSSRAGVPHAGSTTNPDRPILSYFRQRKVGNVATSPRDQSIAKDDNSSSQISPSASMASSCQNSGKTSKDGQVSPSSETMYSRATVPTFFCDKPPHGPVVQSISKTPTLGNEKYVSCAASINSRQSLRKKNEFRRELRTSLKLPKILGLECPDQSTSPTKFSTGDDMHDCDAEMIESLHPIAYPSSSDPATYSSGKGPPESHLSSLKHSEESNDPHIDQSRSPPSAPHIPVPGANLHLNPLEFGALDRNISWRILAERGVLAAGALRLDRTSSELNLEDAKNLSNDMSSKNVNESPSMNGSMLKLEVQVDKKDIFEPENVKLGQNLGRINWELRLSKREAALRIAEEKVLEEQHSVSQARLAVSRCEANLRQRELEVQRESEKQKSDFGESVKSIETGRTVINKLYTGLKDVLWHLEQKERMIQTTWLELKESIDFESMLGDHSFGFEPETSQKDTRSATFDGISFLIAEGKCEEWCSTVVGICERLVSYMSRETHLQNWATILEREGVRMAKMAKEIAKAKEAANEQCARSEDMMKCADEQAACMDEERVKLARERDNLILWVTHLQERRKAVAECEREAATSLAEVQKKAADLFVHESNIDGRALEISSLQEELRVTSQRLQDDQELINREKHKVQEKLRQAVGREREADSKISVMKKLQEELNTKAEQLEKDRAVDEKRKEKLLFTLQETEGKINAKEMSLHQLEKELEHKVASAEEMTNNLNEREKLLSELQRQMEQERFKVREMMASLGKGKVRLKEAEEAIAEAHSSKKSAEEAWARTAQERRESTEYLKSVEERLKQWDDRLRIKEKELQGQQKKLLEIENQAREEQEHSEALHAKLVQEQESWSLELKAKQESLSKRNRILDAKEEEINNDLERLTEERRVTLEDIKRLAEMEARAWNAERDLQAKHDDHLKEVRKHATEYHSQVEDLELAKREVKNEFEEVRAKKQELKIWQREAEETLHTRIDSFVKGKEELTAQIKELKKLQMDIEKAGSQIIDRVAELDQASNRLERQRHKVETSKTKLEGLADKLATHQEVLKRRESEFLIQESKLVAIQNGLKKMAAEAATKEKNLKSREQAVTDSENELRDVEARLVSERKDLEKMIAEVEQHAAKLKEETASVEEINRNRTRDEVMIEEKREQLLSKERELTDFETDLRTKAKSLEEHGQTISKLEMQVKERLQRAVEFETKSEELEKGWERLAAEREALNSAKMEIQKTDETHKVQWQLDIEKDQNKRQRAETLEVLRVRQAALEAREAKSIEKETSLLVMEQDTKAHKDQVEKDAQLLRQQLHGARAELEDQRRYVEEKRNEAEAMATIVEEREARLKLKEQELAERKADVAHRMSKPEKKEVLLGCQQVSKDFRGEQVWVNQMDECMEDRVKQMEEAFQKEADRISQERADLKVQQQDLEETRKAVEEVKLTLTAQLKATKQMVADASMTAQNASRERESLEEERKRLDQDRKNAEASVAAKEEKLALEAKQLEKMTSMLEQEKTKAMELIQQAAKRAMAAELAKVECSNISRWDSIMMQQNVSQCEASLNDRERELSSTAEAIRREKTSLKEERVQVKLLQDALEREQMEYTNVNLRNAAKVEVLVKDAGSRISWEEIKKRRERERVGGAYGWDQTAEGTSNGRNHIAEQDFSFSAMKDGLEINGGRCDVSEGCTRNKQAHRGVANHKVSNMKWDEAFGFATSSISGSYTPEKTTGNSSFRHIIEKNDVPSRKRLENVMTSLMQARQASRSRLQRTENALLAIPPSSGFITQVQQALNTLSARLRLMEQIEEGLESHLRNAYETEASESEGMLVDKVQLLSRMEEQQSLRAEWEEDMQSQLETISMLQAASRSSSNFCTPPRILNQGAPPLSDKQNHSINVYQEGKEHAPYDMITSVGNAGEVSNADPHDSGGSRPSKQFSTHDWNSTFEPQQIVDSKELSYSPFVDYDYLSNPANQQSVNFGTHDLESLDRNTRRRLLLSPPQMTFG